LIIEVAKNWPWENDYHYDRFRLTKKDDKFGLVRDVKEVALHQFDEFCTYSEEILKPIYDYDDIPDAVFKIRQDEEIEYYAYVLSEVKDYKKNKDLRNVPVNATNYTWDDVPEEIRDEVRIYMENNGM